MWQVYTPNTPADMLQPGSSNVQGLSTVSYFNSNIEDLDGCIDTVRKGTSEVHGGAAAKTCRLGFNPQPHQIGSHWKSSI